MIAVPSTPPPSQQLLRPATMCPRAIDSLSIGSPADDAVSVPIGPERTGIPGLDQILGGGLPGRGIVVVVGVPGAGKTLLVQQLAFHAARSGRRALYFSSLSEPHERLVEHLRPFSFFDESMLGDSVQFLSLGSAAEQGAAAAASAVMQTTRRAGAGLVIIDGLRRLRDILPDEPHGRNFLHRLGSQVGLLGALLVVILEDRPPGEELLPELAVGDVLLGLFFERTAFAHRRYLEVYKRRGAAHLPGLHAVTIGPGGIVCYPQFELTIAPDEAPIVPSDRAGSGVPDLDATLGGGLTRRTATVVAGNPGTGKTLFGLHFLAEGIRAGEPGLFVGFRESPPQLLLRGSALGVDLADSRDRGLLHVLAEPPVGLDPDILAHRIRQTVQDAGISRLVLDAVPELTAVVGPRRISGFLAALFTVLRERGVTTVLTNETSNLFGLDVGVGEVPISGLFDNVIILQHVESDGRVKRQLSVIKMRFSEHDRAIHELTIGEAGLRLLPPGEPEQQASSCTGTGGS
jgi:circadian clock protein KaiC